MTECRLEQVRTSMKISTQYPHTTRRALLFWIMGVVVGFSGYMFVSTLIQALWLLPDSELAVPLPVSTTVAVSSPPERLVIPSLNIDAAVQHVGVGKSGNMAVPNNYSDVGWYRLGAPPGQIGSAVMDGHVDNGFALPAVFKHLGDIKKGDDIYVVQGDGSKIAFVVTDIQLYPYKSAPTDFIFNRRDKARLNLITCEGVWDAVERTYDRRLVVFAELQGASRSTKKQ